MSRISILGADTDWEVWIGLDNDYAPPAGHSFVIGCGDSRDTAIADAVKDLEAALDTLQQPPMRATA